MSESCCGISDTEDRHANFAAESKTPRCPTCDHEGPGVDRQTVAAMTRDRVAPRQDYRLCRELECPTVYYGDRGTLHGIADMHVVPGFKTAGPEGPVCYCFMHSRREIEEELQAGGETTVPQRITAQIKAGNCACEVRNPAGHCCLGEVNQAVATISERLSEVLT